MEHAPQLLAAGLLDERASTVDEGHQSLARIRIACLRCRNDVDAVLDAFKALGRVAHRVVGVVDISGISFDMPEPINGGLIHAERLAPLVYQVADIRGIGETAKLLAAQSRSLGGAVDGLIVQAVDLLVWVAPQHPGHGVNVEISHSSSSILQVPVCCLTCNDDRGEHTPRRGTRARTVAARVPRAHMWTARRSPGAGPPT